MKEKKRSKFSQWMRGELESQKFSASFGPSLKELAFVRGHELQISNSGKSDNPFKPYTKFNTKGLKATVRDATQMDSYISKAAVGGGALVGAVILGPIGAIAGGLIGSTKRKGGTQISVLIERGDEVLAIVSGPVAQEMEAIKFAKCINDSAADAELGE